MERGDKVDITHIIPAPAPGLIKDSTIHGATIHEVTPMYVQVAAGKDVLVIPWSAIRQIVVKSGNKRSSAAS